MSKKGLVLVPVHYLALTPEQAAEYRAAERTIRRALKKNADLAPDELATLLAALEVCRRYEAEPERWHRRTQMRQLAKAPRPKARTQVIVELRDALRKRGMRGTSGEVFNALCLKYPNEKTRDGEHVVHEPSERRPLTLAGVASRLSRHDRAKKPLR